MTNLEQEASEESQIYHFRMKEKAAFSSQRGGKMDCACEEPSKGCF